MSVSLVMQQKELVKGRRDIWAGGMILLKVDRSPGRVIVACREVFGILQKATFLENQRYAALDLVPSAEDDSFAQTIRASFKEAVPGCERWIGRRPSGGSNRPSCYWTIKQKSLLMSCTQPNIKVRPIVSYCLHPLRVAFRRIARALAVLVTDARKVVMEKRPTHLPMWQLHSGSAEWLQRLVATRGGWGLEEFDVSDCFLNTPRESVLAAVKFWMVTTQSRTRRQPCFGISKDGKAGDHRGRHPVMHYWVITAEQIMSVCQ